MPLASLAIDRRTRLSHRHRHIHHRHLHRIHPHWGRWPPTYSSNQLHHPSVFPVVHSGGFNFLCLSFIVLRWLELYCA